MKKQDLGKKAVEIVDRECRKSAAFFGFVLFFAIMDFSIACEGFYLLALFLLAVPVCLWHRHEWKRRIRLRMQLEEKCMAETMKDVYAYYLCHPPGCFPGMRGKNRTEANRGVIRAEIYMETVGEKTAFEEVLGGLKGGYERLFLAFVQDDKESFFSLLPKFLELQQQYFSAASGGKKRKREYIWYQNSLKKLDVYQAFMEENTEDFLRCLKAEKRTFTTAEKVILAYKAADILACSDKAEAEKAWYYVLSAGGEMPYVGRVADRMKDAFPN